MDLDKILPVSLTFVGVIVLAIVGRVVFSRYRKRLTGTGQEAIGAWSLDDLEGMRDSGQLTDQEYQLLRQRMIGKVMDSKGGAKAKPNPSAGRNDNISR